MDFIIYSTFDKSLERLNNEEQKQTKITVMDLQLAPDRPGHQLHKIDRARDSRFATIRVNRDLRIVVYQDGSRMVICYVDHHDAAYRWAQNRRFEEHPITGSAQIVEVVETVEQVTRIQEVVVEKKPAALGHVSTEDLLGYGVPQGWVSVVREADEEYLLNVAEHLPQEAQEAVLQLMVGELPTLPTPRVEGQDPFQHPDAQRSFRIVSNQEELERALEFPWERWMVYLHPDQRYLVEKSFNGPARVSGSAGTGKTVVALHRAVHLARQHPESRVLLATFSETLARALEAKLRRLLHLHKEPRLREQVEVLSMERWGRRLHSANFGRTELVSPEQIRTLIQEAAQSTPGHAFQTPFLLAEWNEIIDAWQLKDWKEYQNFKRLGRKSRVSPSQREVLWSIFTQVQQKLRDQNLITDAERFTQLAHRFAGMPQTLYEFMVVDEAQDISVSQLRLLATVAGERENALFLCGDQGQQIFQAPFSWKAVGVNIQGRSRNLKINYRTSHQIRFQADRLLDESLSDLDGNTESRRGTISVFNGPVPEVLGCEDEQMEIKRVVGWLQQRIDSGVQPREIGIFIRSEAQLPRALEVVKLLEIPHQVLDAQVDPASGKACISSMHLAKGLEFRVVVVMACDENVVPLNERIQSASEETEIEAIHQSERHLLYVACTRARDQLLISFVTPGSEFLLDLK